MIGSTADVASGHEVLQILNHCDGICENLSAWARSRPAADEPLTVLLIAQINHLASNVHSFKTQVATEAAHARTGTPLAAGHDSVVFSPDLSRSLTCTKLCLLETIEAVDFYNREERHGHGGALNKLFASKFILNRNEPRHAGRAYYNQDKLLRIGLEIWDLIRGLVPQLVTSEGAMARFSMLQPKIEGFLSRTAEQFGPAYVHTYQTLAETPYAIDTAGKSFPGTNATVQRVNHKGSGEALAMKTFQNVFSKKDMREISRELRVLEVCDHRNIVQLVEAFRLQDDDQSVHLVMAPWAPCTLFTFLRMSNAQRKARCPWFKPDAPESDRCIYRILSELADGVGYLHSLPVKHKDLKPDNILLYREGTDDVTPLITDVGISKVHRPGAKTNYNDGTYVYLAPEQDKLKASTLESDIWQLGCCFAELLAVAKAGTSGYEKLHGSFNREEVDCACSIAREHEPFMRTLAEICTAGRATLRRAYIITTAMLDPDPTIRPNIESVRATLSKWPGLNSA
ncbi:Serine/threonine-protein kinase H1 [Madurella mycetomatis]|uniref:Serine/threonine-protein kinase H1 n=1 Tax=Madurella mycetomatis TaxID=100816 RepID=A0A175VRD7_9PEZI|nr:Serine/threonine-protein kinase H1 [Madurella mycetomatis]